MIAIRCEGLSKRYRLGEQERYRALRDVITEAAVTPLRQVRARFSSNNGNGNSIGNHQSAMGNAIWALEDVSFEVEQGDVIGIIGRNGAGKSTLLKILSRITKPTRGHAEIKGRVGSLLEVGTGFHPELTGRENIYLNGAILGMRKAEIDQKFDEIVAFAEIEKFVDTPVKRYSSGMYVRLAFAVAAHMETEVLVVDEVLAVGDAEFQKKCLGKMGDVAKDGRTVLFVSHNMGAVSRLCQKGVLLHDGRLEMCDSVLKTVNAYRHISSLAPLSEKNFTGTLTSILKFREIAIAGNNEEGQLYLSPASPIELRVKGAVGQDLPHFRVTFSIYVEGTRLVTLHDVQEPELLPKGEFEARVWIPPFFLRPGEYSLAVGGHRDGMNEWIWGMNLRNFSVVEEWSTGFDPFNLGIVNLPHSGQRKSWPGVVE